MLHAIALHQQGFTLQRREGALFDIAQQKFAQTFHAVAVKNHETRGRRRGHVRLGVIRAVSLSQDKAQGVSFFESARYTALFSRLLIVNTNTISTSSSTV